MRGGEDEQQCSSAVLGTAMHCLKDHEAGEGLPVQTKQLPVPVDLWSVCSAPLTPSPLPPSLLTCSGPLPRGAHGGPAGAVCGAARLAAAPAAAGGQAAAREGELLFVGEFLGMAWCDLGCSVSQPALCALRIYGCTWQGAVPLVAGGSELHGLAPVGSLQPLGRVSVPAPHLISSLLPRQPPTKQGPAELKVAAD